MAILGPSSLLDIALPPGVDGNVIFKFQMQEGLTVQEVIALATTVIGEANEQVVTRYGSLISITESMYAVYRQGSGGRRVTPTKAEFAKADPVRSDKIGHMLPRWDYEDATGWDSEYLRRANREMLRRDLLEIRDGWVNRVDLDVLTRMFSREEVVISSTAWSPGWAIGTGTNLNYIPPQWRSYKHNSTHTHYIRVNAAISSANAATTLDSMAKHLAHHGHSGRKVAIVSEEDLSIYQGISSEKYANMLNPEFRYVGGNSNSPVAYMPEELEGIPGEVFGAFASAYGTVYLSYHEGVPSGFLWMGKSYGVDNPQNPLAIRAEPGYGFGMKVEPMLRQTLTPALDSIHFPATHGVGVNDRTAGVAAQIATGGTSYENPVVAA